MTQLADLYPDCLPLDVQKTVRETLSADPFFAEKSVRIFIQDDGELNDLIARGTLPLEAPLLLVALSEIEGNSPDITLHFAIVVLEDPITNRAKPDFDTALGIAWHTTRLLDGETFHFDRLTCQLNDDGLFQVTAAFRY